MEKELQIDTMKRRFNSNFLPLKYPNFGKLFIGQVISNIGSQFSYLALQFMIYDLTGEIIAMALLAMAEAIPMIIIGPWAGIIIDRIDRKHSMALANFCQAFVIILIPFTSLLPNRVLWIFILAFFNSAFARFFFPARGASIPKLIDDKKDLFGANAFTVGAYQVSVLLGPMLAGIITGVFGYDIAFIIDSMSFIFSSVCILSINVSLRAEKKSEQTPLEDFITGGRYILNFHPLRYLLVVFSILMFAGGASLILIIPYLQTQFGLTEQGPREFVFGLMSAASAAVGITVALLLSKKRELNSPITLIHWTMFSAGAILIIFGNAPNLLIVGLAWIGFGTIEVSIGIPLQTIAQETVPDELRGKIFSFLNLAMTLSQIIGMGIISALASFWLGIRGSFMLSGSILLGFFILGYIWLKQKNLEKLVRDRRKEFQTSVNFR